MYVVGVKETYQRTIDAKVHRNFELTRYYRDIEELKVNIDNMQRELVRMDVVDITTTNDGNSVSRKFEYHRPGRIGTLMRTITIRKYNPPKQVELI